LVAVDRAHGDDLVLEPALGGRTGGPRLALGGEGVEVVGPLPPDIQLLTTFSGGIAPSSAQLDAARALLAFFGSPLLRGIKQAHGMDAP
ncbi:MAG TPA: substrate-binding domain-containing protein, partial [Vicinamibacterales bacterium]|nr:substrate-binding domain-containing protein [Vicinamibacterales bacterium]